MQQHPPHDIVLKSERLFDSHNPTQRTALEAEISDFVGNHQNINVCLAHLKDSSKYMFVFAELLAKALQKGRYIPLDILNDLKSSSGDAEERGIIIQQILSLKRATYGEIILALQQFLMADSLQPHIRNQCVNVISLCLRWMCDNSEEQEVFVQFLAMMFPGCPLTKEFNNNYNPELRLISLKAGFSVPTCFLSYIKVLSSLIEYVQIAAYYKSYFQYRRNIYTFKNNYMGYVLQVAIYYLKAAVYLEQSLQSQSLSVLLQLFDQIVSYPFSLNLNEYDNDEEVKEYHKGEIFFPGYFRNVTNDIELVDGLSQLYQKCNASQLPFSTIRPEILNTLKILYKLFSANSYYFDTQTEKRRFRKDAITKCHSILRDIKYTEPSVINALLEMVFRITNLYTARDFGETLVPFISQIFMVCKLIVTQLPIVVDGEGNNNCTLIFSILYQLQGHAETQTSDSMIFQTGFMATKQISQILQLFYNRIIRASNVSPPEEQDVTKQIQSFSDFYSSIHDIIKLSDSDNLQLMLRVDCGQLPPVSQQFWVYLLVAVMSQTGYFFTLKERKIELVFKVFNEIKDLNYPFVYRFIDLITKKFLEKVGDDSDDLLNIFQRQGSTIHDYLVFTIRKLVNSLYTNENTLSYAMEILNNVYSLLKKMGPDVAKQYSQILKDFFDNIGGSLFNKPQHYKMRIDLFQLISVIWIEEKCHTEGAISTIYQLYEKVAGSLKGNLLLYLYDTTGLLRPIQHFAPFKIVAELIVTDIEKITVTQEDVDKLMAVEELRKAFIKLGLELSNDQYGRLKRLTHSSLPLRIEKILYPYLKKAAEYPYGKSLIKMYNRFIGLSCIGQSLPLPRRQNCQKPYLSTDINALVGNYFEQIYRVSNLQSLYDYIYDNADYFYSWCEELIGRNMHTSPHAIEALIESRAWQTIRREEMCAKAMWMLAKYDNRYRVVPELWAKVSRDTTEEDFVEVFINHYKS